MSEPLLKIAAQMYRALMMCPCRCRRQWDKEQPEGYRITHTCSRCLAMRAYETAASLVAG
jgi:hypothetical protein